MVSNLKKAMKKASDELNYEKAADIRNRINQVEVINEKQAITPNGIDADIFSVEKVNNYAGICIVTIWLLCIYQHSYLPFQLRRYRHQFHLG